MGKHFPAGLNVVLSAATLSAVLVACAALPRDDKSTVWMLRDVTRVGSHVAEMVGAPKVEGAGADTAIVFDGKSDGLFVPANLSLAGRRSPSRSVSSPTAPGARNSASCISRMT